MIRTLVLVALVAAVAAQTAVTPAAKPANATAAAPAKPAAVNATAAKPAAATATAPAATAKSAVVPAAAGAGAAVAQNGAAPGDTAAVPASKCGASVTETPFKLASISGKGCENNDALLGKPYTCAPTMLANVTDITGPAADCTYPGEINLSSGEASCVDDTGASVGLLGNGKVQPAEAGVRSFNGTWLFAKPGPFNGKVNADGSVTITTELKDGTVCELTYTAGTAKKPIKLPADEAAMYVAQAQLDAEQVKEDSAAIANGTMPAPEAKKSSAAAAGASGLLLLLGAAAALF